MAALDRSKTVILLPVSPLEGHGPHLPLGVDFFDAKYFSDRLAGAITERRTDFDVVICPGLPVGTQLYKQAGSLRIKPLTLYNLIKETGYSLTYWGFKYIFVLSGHGSPRDIVTIESACKKVSIKRKIQMHNISGAIAVRFLNGEFVERISAGLPDPLSPTDLNLMKKDIHGGWWETSMMLQVKPELVDESYKSLPFNEKSGDNPNPGLGYYGSPSRASLEFAGVSTDIITNEAAEIVERCLRGEDITSDTVSPLWRIRTLRPTFKRSLYFGILFSIKACVIVWLIYKYIIR